MQCVLSSFFLLPCPRTHMVCVPCQSMTACRVRTVVIVIVSRDDGIAAAAAGPDGSVWSTTVRPFSDAFPSSKLEALGRFRDCVV